MPLPILLALTVVQTTQPFGPDPKMPWVAVGVALAYREGLITGYPDPPYGRGGRLPSRYEYILPVHAAARNHLQRAEAFLAHPTSEVERASLLRAAVLLPFYRRAEREFKTELADLGVSDDFGQSRLAAVTRQIEATAPARSRPFRDVPPDHWAAKAVGDLRALGFLDGYPDARYRG